MLLIHETLLMQCWFKIQIHYYCKILQKKSITIHVLFYFINFYFGIGVIEIWPNMLSQKIAKLQMDQTISVFHLYMYRIRYSGNTLKFLMNSKSIELISWWWFHYGKYYECRVQQVHHVYTKVHWLKFIKCSSDIVCVVSCWKDFL